MDSISRTVKRKTVSLRHQELIQQRMLKEASSGDEKKKKKKTDSFCDYEVRGMTSVTQFCNVISETWSLSHIIYQSETASSCLLEFSHQVNYRQVNPGT